MLSSAVAWAILRVEFPWRKNADVGSREARDVSLEGEAGGLEEEDVL
jgi:hypothetical protein